MVTMSCAAHTMCRRPHVHGCRKAQGAEATTCGGAQGMGRVPAERHPPPAPWPCDDGDWYEEPGSDERCAFDLRSECPCLHDMT